MKNTLKLIIQAGKATPAPPIGPALGQRGLNIMDFCKQFNDKTSQKTGPIPVLIHFTKDKKFTIEIKAPPASYLIMKAAGIDKGSKEPGKVMRGTVTKTQLIEIAKEKIDDLRTNSIDASVSVLAGTAISMGISVDYNN